MAAPDFRSIGRAAQEELRRHALGLVLQQGLSQAQAAQAVGVQRQTVNTWLQRHRAQGQDGVLDGRRVSPRRGKGLLTAEEAGQLQDWLCDRRFDHLQGSFALWTNQAVGDLIARRFGKTLGSSTVQLYLQRWGMTPQQPLALAKERSPTAVAVWLATTYPAIVKRARAERAAIYWGATTRIAQQGPIEHVDAPRGPTPDAHGAQRIAHSMSSAVSNRGQMRFMLHAGPLTAPRFITFLRRLSEDAQREVFLRQERRQAGPKGFLRRLSKDAQWEVFLRPLRQQRRQAGPKVFLIVDHQKVHHADKVEKWIAAQAGEIELFHLPL